MPGSLSRSNRLTLRKEHWNTSRMLEKDRKKKKAVFVGLSKSSWGGRNKYWQKNCPCKFHLRLNFEMNRLWFLFEYKNPETCKFFYCLVYLTAQFCILKTWLELQLSYHFKYSGIALPCPAKKQMALLTFKDNLNTLNLFHCQYGNIEWRIIGMLFQTERICYGSFYCFRGINMPGLAECILLYEWARNELLLRKHFCAKVISGDQASGNVELISQHSQ